MNLWRISRQDSAFVMIMVATVIRVVVGAKVLGLDCLTPDARLGGLGQMTDLWLGFATSLKRLL